MPSSPCALRRREQRLRRRRRGSAGVCQAGPVELELVEQPAAVLVGQLEQRVAVEPQQVEDHVDDGLGLREPPDLGLAGRGACATAGAGSSAAPFSNDTISPSRIDLVRAERAAELARAPGSRGVIVVLRRLIELEQPAALDVGHRAHAVPLDLVRPARRPRGSSPGAREHRLDPFRQRRARRVLRRVHPVDHPVLAAGLEQDVLAAHALAVERDHDLLVTPLVDLEGAAVEDLHRPGAVVALRDLAVEVQVLERVVLGLDRQVVALGVDGDALRDRPADERALVLEPQIPVHRARGVLLHDEPQLLARLDRPGGFGRVLEVALCPISVQPISHRAHCGVPSGTSGYRARPYGRQPHRP